MEPRAIACDGSTTLRDCAYVEVERFALSEPLLFVSASLVRGRCRSETAGNSCKTVTGRALRLATYFWLLTRIGGS